VATAEVAGAETELEQIIAEQRDRLLDKLALQRDHAVYLWGWYHGEQEYPVVKSKYRDAYRLLIELAPTPWARLVVDTIAERLHVQGFRTGAAATDAEAWRLFKASSMDADERLVYTEALVTGTGYVSVSDGGVIAPESVFEVTHEPAAGNRRQVAAAVKVYPLDWALRDWALELYRPDATYRWTATVTEPLEPGGFPLDGDARKPPEWEPADPFVSANPLGVVPIVPFENRATILGGGVSELEDCIPLLRRIDKLSLDLLLTSDVAAFRQKWATGLEVPTDPETGKKVEPWKAAVDRVWVSEKPDAKFGTFEASDLNQYLKALDAQIAALAAISRVPAHYLMQSNLANPPTAESLVASESGLVAKVRERQRRFGEGWERAESLAFELGGAEPPDPLEVIWQDAEMRNPAQVADAATKLQTIGVPQRALWEYVGATPQQLAEWTLESAAAELVAIATAPTPASSPNGGPGPAA
jgi:Phage portal protein, SPP1 Gp6-like